uniref:Putative secreted protein n=1 Tax=Ixodes ricinus TaxID=34613 RepID=V5HH59_IXORI
MKLELLALVLLFGVAASAPHWPGWRPRTMYVCIQGRCHPMVSGIAQPRRSPFFQSLAECRASCFGHPGLPGFWPSPPRPDFPEEIHDDYIPSLVRPK